jgi:hypothetical protein
MSVVNFIPELVDHLKACNSDFLGPNIIERIRDGLRDGNEISFLADGQSGLLISAAVAEAPKAQNNTINVQLNLRAKAVGSQVTADAPRPQAVLEFPDNTEPRARDLLLAVFQDKLPEYAWVEAVRTSTHESGESLDHSSFLGAPAAEPLWITHELKLTELERYSLRLDLGDYNVVTLGLRSRDAQNAALRDDALRRHETVFEIKPDWPVVLYNQAQPLFQIAGLKENQPVSIAGALGKIGRRLNLPQSLPEVAILELKSDCVKVLLLAPAAGDWFNISLQDSTD